MPLAAFPVVVHVKPERHHPDLIDRAPPHRRPSPACGPPQADSRRKVVLVESTDWRGVVELVARVAGRYEGSDVEPDRLRSCVRDELLSFRGHGRDGAESQHERPHHAVSHFLTSLTFAAYGRNAIPIPLRQGWKPRQATAIGKKIAPERTWIASRSRVEAAFTYSDCMPSVT